MTAAYFAHHSYQIAISGDLKDMEQDEASLIQTMGMESSTNGDGIVYFSTSGISLVFAYALTIVQCFCVLYAVFLTSPSTVEVIVTAALLAIVVAITDEMLKQGRFLRSRRLKWISLKEFVGYTAIHFAAVTTLSYWLYGLVVLSMVVYLASTSKFIWGTYLVPQV
ncbi:MAG: hypothetical protein J07AB43_01190 [Candidatus Nanosalina sp. J07AB43]|nr:MAG: hypothetical protein J07AB43_01190 [Candidatus Nanosalina sp. J07AB43]